MGHLCSFFFLRSWCLLDREKPENLFLAHVDERQQLPECTCFASLRGHSQATPTGYREAVKSSQVGFIVISTIYTVYSETKLFTMAQEVLRI